MSRRLIPVLAALAALASTPAAADAARLVPIDPRVGRAWAINDQGWVVAGPTGTLSFQSGGAGLVLWRNGPFARLEPPAGEAVSGPAFFSGDGTRVLGQARATPTAQCTGEHAVVYALSGSDAALTSLQPLPGQCGAWATGFADDVPVGMARRSETIPGLAEIGVPPGEFTTIRPMVRAVRWSSTGGPAVVDGTPPAPIISGTDYASARAVTFHTRLLAANANGDVLAQRSAMTWAPEPFDWNPTIPLPVVELRRGTATTVVPLNGAGPNDVFGTPGTAWDLSRPLVLGEAGQVLEGRGYWAPGSEAQQVPFSARGMSPTGRVVGVEQVAVPGALYPVAEARVWFNGRVTDLAKIARQVSPAHAALFFSADGPASRKAYVLAGCPLSTYQAGGGTDERNCQRFRLDLVSIFTGEAVAPAPPVLAPTRAPRPAAGVVLSATDGTTTVRTTSGRDGRFSLELPAGTWRVSLVGRGGCLRIGSGACRATVQLTADGIANGTLAVRADAAGAAAALAKRRAAVRTGKAQLRLTCRRVLGCTGSVRLLPRRGSALLGSASVRLRFGTQTVRVPLKPAARASLSARGSLAARATFRPAGGRALALGAVVLAR